MLDSLLDAISSAAAPASVVIIAISLAITVFNVLYTQHSARKNKLSELSYRDAAAAFSEYLTAGSVVPKPISPEYLAEFSGKYERARLYASKRTRPVLEKHFLAAIRSPESLEPDEAAHALKLNRLRNELLITMQKDLRR